MKQGLMLGMASVVMGLAGCTGGDSTCTGASQVKLSDIQASIFTPSCAIPACHSGGMPQEGLDLSAGQSYAATVSVKSQLASSKLIVDPNDAADSELYLQVEGGLMPQVGSPLTSDQIKQIHDWICVGAPND